VEGRAVEEGSAREARTLFAIEDIVHQGGP